MFIMKNTLSLISICLSLLCVPVVAQQNVTPLENDLQYISDNALAVLVIKPAEMLQDESLKANSLADLTGASGLKPSEVARLVVAVLPGEDPLFEPLVFAQVNFTDPQSRFRLKPLLAPNAKRLTGLPFPLYDNSAAMGGMSLAFPNKNTMLVCSRVGGLFDAIRYANAGALPKPHLVEMCGQSNAPVYFAADADRLLHFLSFSRGRAGDGMFLKSPLPPHKLISNLRGAFVFGSKPCFQLDVKALNSKQISRFQKTFSEYLQARQHDLLTFAKQMVAYDPKLTVCEQAIVELLSDLKILNHDQGLRIQLDEKAQPAASWMKLMLGVGLFRADQQRRLSHVRTQNKLRLISLAILNYEAAYGKLPENIKSQDGKPLLSWRVSVLPMMGYSELFRRFKMDEPWDSPHNRQLISSMPKELRIDEAAKNSRLNQETPIQSPILDKVTKLGDITDGTSETVLVLLAEETVPWTQPRDFSHNPNDPWRGIRSDAHFSMVDGRTTVLSKQVIGKKLLAAFTHAAGDSITFEFEKSYDYEKAEKERDEFWIQQLTTSGMDPIHAKGVMVNEPLSHKEKDMVVELLDAADPYLVAFALTKIDAARIDVDWKRYLELLNSRYDFIRRKTVELMAESKQQGLLVSIYQMDLRDALFVDYAIRESGIGELYAVKELTPMLSAKDRDQRIAAAYAILNFGQKKDRRLIETLLGDEDSKVRGEAKRLLEFFDKKFP